MHGVFIVLEGPDGSGTSTHAALLAERLIGQNKDVLLTKEPTDGPIGVFIRQNLMKEGLSADALQMLFCADRAWHLEEVVKPALKQGKTVICDRYMLSTLVYGKALGLSPTWLESLNTNFIQPNHQILLLPSFATCMERVGKRASRDILEEDSLQRKVYDGYKDYAQTGNLPIVDTAVEREEAAEKIAAILS